jgi:DNA-binding response OmpR family regulator
MSQLTSVKAAKILIIEDSAFVRRSFVAAFEDEGYEVYSAPDGRSGLELFKARNPDLVMTDLRMTGIDGLGVIAEVRKTSFVPVVVVSAIEDSAVKGACLDAGANDYIIKGRSIEDLLARVERQLGQPE